MKCSLPAVLVAAITGVAPAQGVRLATSFAPITFGPQAMVPMDLNADSRDDLVLLAASPLRLEVRLSDGNGGFSLRQSIAFNGSALGRWDTGDLDGDGDADLVLLSPTDTAVHVLLNNSDGTLTPASDSPLPSSDAPQAIAHRRPGRRRDARDRGRGPKRHAGVR